ncbi:MAG: hypothetical protein CMB55_07365 [Euryarchaeota archaeon]|nr:hypothetical protein [Euryarchaeota archaeon]
MDLMTVFAIICLLIVAVAFSPLGLGGGILYVPIMHYMLDWEIKEALVASLTLVLMVSLGSSLAHSKSGFADHKIANWGRMAAVPSAIIGTLLSGVLLSLVGDIGIKILAALVITFVLERTIRKSVAHTVEFTEEQLLEKRNQYLAGSSSAGIAAGILGIGGGAILVTLNRSMLKMDAKKAAGTSYLVTATIVPVALLSHLVINQNLDVIVDHSGIFAMVLVPLMVFSSAFFGAKYAIKYLPKQVVTGVFLFVVSISLLRYIVDFLTVI